MLVNDFVRLRLRDLRLERKLRLVDVAVRAAIPLGSYSCIETGRYRISLENLFRILHALDAGIGDVWPDTNGLPPPSVMDDAFIQKVLGDAHEAVQRTAVTAEDILKAVSRRYGVSLEGLCGPSRQRGFSEPRAVACVLTGEFRHLSKTRVARLMGRDSSSLVHSARRLKEKLTHRHLTKVLRATRRELEKVVKEKAGA